MSWLELTSAFLFFFLSHSVPVKSSVKNRLLGYLGSTGFSAAYSALSILALAWIIVAAGRAPYIELWAWHAWQSWVTIGLMLVASLLICLTIGKPNPFSFGGTNNELFNPKRPGVLRWMRHPLLVVLMLWSVGHIVPNGNLAHVLVFSSFASFAVLGTKLIDRRRKREMGLQWHELVEQTSRQPLDFQSGDILPVALRIVIGLAVFFCALLLHQDVIGVAPLPV